MVVDADTVVEAEAEVGMESEVEVLAVLTADVGGVTDEVGEAEVEWTVDDASEGLELATEVAEVGAARVLVRSLVGEGEEDGGEAAPPLEERDACEVVPTDGVAGLACAANEKGLRIGKSQISAECSRTIRRRVGTLAFQRGRPHERSHDERKKKKRRRKRRKGTLPVGGKQGAC